MSKRIKLSGLVLAAVVLALLYLGWPRFISEAPRAELVVVDPVPAPPPVAPQTPAPVETAANADPASPPVNDVASPAGTAPDGSRRFLFECGKGIFFAIRVVPGEATVFSPPLLGPDVLTLPETEAASGARYASGGDVFWNKGELATFEVRGQNFVDCTSNPSAVIMAEARRRGVVFRALGNEPSWLLEIYRERIVLTTELGQRVTEFPFREPTVTAGATTYRVFSGTQELTAVASDTRCNDTMSGEVFDKTVAVTFEGTTLYGCGGMPADAAQAALN
jgi:putative lipoprotein